VDFPQFSRADTKPHANCPSTNVSIALISASKALNSQAKRAGLRAALPRTAPARACPVCWAAAAAERALVTDVRSAATGRGGALPADRLCRQHLRDAASGPGLLAWQAELEAKCLAGALDGKPRLLGIAPGRLSPRARRAVADPDCAVCRGSRHAAADQLCRVASSLREGIRVPALCARHVSPLRGADAVAGRLAAGEPTERPAGNLSKKERLHSQNSRSISPST
jgi:hypothetical protein